MLMIFIIHSEQKASYEPIWEEILFTVRKNTIVRLSENCVSQSTLLQFRSFLFLSTISFSPITIVYPDNLEF